MNENEILNLEGISEVGAEKKEFDTFDEGLKRTLEIVESLLETQHYVVVAVSGPDNDTNIGKSRITGEIMKACFDSQIPSINFSDRKENMGEGDIVLLRDKQKTFVDNSDRGVIVFGEMSSFSGSGNSNLVEIFKKAQDNSIATSLSNLLGIEKIDIRVFIYRQGQKVTPNDRIYADVIIRNEKAKSDKKIIG